MNKDFRENDNGEILFSMRGTLKMFVFMMNDDPSEFNDGKVKANSILADLFETLALRLNENKTLLYNRVKNMNKDQQSAFVEKIYGTIITNEDIFKLVGGVQLI